VVGGLFLATNFVPLRREVNPEVEGNGLDASRGPTYTEAHRHACEVRYVLAMPDKNRRRAYLEGVEKARGKSAADRLREGVMKAWKER
jgi:hypothetical protein